MHMASNIFRHDTIGLGIFRYIRGLNWVLLFHRFYAAKNSVLSSP